MIIASDDEDELDNSTSSSPKTFKSSSKSSRKNSPKRIAKVEPPVPSLQLSTSTSKRPSEDIINSKDIEDSSTLSEDISDQIPEGYRDSDSEPDVSVSEIAEIAKLPHELANKCPFGPTWKKGQPIPYSSLTNVFETIEGTTKRLEIISYCADFFLSVLRGNPQALTKVTYLFINRLGPDYEGIELGLGESIILKAIAESTGRTLAQLKLSYKEEGDLGTVAQISRSTQSTMFKPQALSVDNVFNDLKAIATSTGSASQTKKANIIQRMLTSCQGNEAKFLIRSLEGKLRIGLAEKTVLIALSQAFVSWESENSGKKFPSVSIVKGEELIRDAFCQVPNYGVIIDTMIKYGIFGLPDHCTVSTGVPLKPMLAKPTHAISEILDRFQGEEFTCEYKYDGERAQIHMLENGEIHVYSRNTENMSQKYPDIVEAVKVFNKPDTKSFIIDCEAVAWDQETKKILPFQVLSTRKRKDVETGNIKIRVCVFGFDILYFNGRSLLRSSLKERREVLKSAFQEVEGIFSFAKYVDSSFLEDIQVFLDKSVEDSCEGLMVKMLNGVESGYEPSKRSRNWLKLKKDYIEGGVGDSIDLVVLGAYHGKGKRTSVYGGYLLGCYNPETEEYETACKVGTGFSDADLESLYAKLHPTEIDRPRSYFVYNSASNTQPDVWFDPTMVWEVKTADLSISPIYTAAASFVGKNGKGVSLRFPRFIRIRDDKDVTDSTSSEQIAEFYSSQVNI
ncbi:ATP-dependent DNA ligase [Nadsonia fulvescens var. elongata DSM 6958]|uniref:DNA ligase n=1 Tax=Nadsonia fulvescens var. elongata DSM 6958 TaxID=857566 RepID=A0A1E3PQ32_9ASCO|nr:ATP-dependent DNA ligase [Nadsonia fulvescens var. elongata DSM 6958]